MKTIGMIGGMSWESTQHYYRLVNERMRLVLGGLHSARCIIYSVDFADVEPLQHAGRWDETGVLLADAARRLESAGAEFLVLCTNTMHKVAGAVEQATGLPLLHIADATAAAVRRTGIRTVGLLGTRFTMEQEFYRGRLADRAGLRVIVPPEEDRALVHRVIYEELCMGAINDRSASEYLRIIAGLVHEGAEGVILGCTEIGLLVPESSAEVPLFDTTRIHAEAAADRALAGGA